MRLGKQCLGLAPFIGAWLVVLCTVKGSGLKTILSGEQSPLDIALTFDEVEDAALLEKGFCVLWVGITMFSQLVSELEQSRSLHSFHLPMGRGTLSRH